MSQFLSDTWFAELNDRLSSSTPHPFPPDAPACRVAFDIVDAPVPGPSALTLLLDAHETTVIPGLPEGPTPADVVLRLTYDDADALTHGRLDSATALREGRIKVRGDVNVLVPLATWLASVFSA